MRLKSIALAVGLTLSLISLPQAGTIYSTIPEGPYHYPKTHGQLHAISSWTGKMGRGRPSASAWSFVVASPGEVTADGVELPLALARSERYPGSEATVELCDTVEDMPGSVLRSVTLVDAVTADWNDPAVLIRFAFESPVNLDAGKTYWIVLRALGSPAAYVKWAPECSNEAMGRGLHQEGGDRWKPIPLNQQVHGGVVETCFAGFRITSP